jgi:ABC-type sugar transport system permease subunit
MRAPGRRPAAWPLLILPSAAYLVALFVYPFAYGVYLSLHPAKGGGGASLANYVAFLGDPWQAFGVVQPRERCLQKAFGFVRSGKLAIEQELGHDRRQAKDRSPSSSGRCSCGS